MIRKIMLGVMAAAVAGILSGCLFDPREAQTPGEEEDTWIIPNTPKDVFSNLETGFSAAANSSYERSLHENFQFIPRMQDWSDPPPWGKSNEMDFIDRIKGEYPGERTIAFGDEGHIFDIREDEEVGHAEYEGKYVITLSRGDGSPAETYAGNAVFIIEKGEANRWVLLSWEDTDIYQAEYSTSSYLRKTYQ